MIGELRSCPGCSVLRPLAEKGISTGAHTWVEGLGPFWALNFNGGYGEKGGCRHSLGTPTRGVRLCRWLEDQGEPGEGEVVRE